YSPKTRFGTGVTVGVIESPEGTTTYQTFLVRLLYTPSAKLSINAEGGLQFRQSRGPFGASATVSTAVISALLNYRPTAKTTVTMRLFRNVDVDAFTPGNLQTITGIEGNISWKISPRAIFDANLLGGYAEYDTLSGQGAGSYLFTQGTLSLSYLFFDDVNVRVFTSMQQRLRDTQGNSYTSTLSGASLGMRF
ncbi:MAG: hypothetical protein N2322_04780, partial [Terrimicrobiaceae bacterium]|nr:hypothetical protein [Terrimicrobiaceae bacterium]